MNEVDLTFIWNSNCFRVQRAIMIHKRKLFWVHTAQMLLDSYDEQISL